MTIIKKIVLLVFCMVLFQISFVAAQPHPDADANASPDPELDPTTVNLLQNGQESDADNVKIEVSELSLRGKVLFLIQEARQRGEEPIVSKEEIDSLSDEELERLVNQAFSQEESALETGERAANLGGTQQQEGLDEDDEEESLSLSSRFIEFLKEHEEEALGGSLLLGAAGAAGYGYKKLYGSEEENEDEGDEEVEEEDNYESYIDTKTASTDAKDSFFSLGGVAEAGERYGGGGGNIDTDEQIETADRAWSYNNCRDRVQYIDTGDQVADAANYMSDLSREAFGKEVPTWFWKTIIRCEVNKGDVLGAHFNNPGGMDYDGWMDRYCVGPVVPTTFVDDGGETHVGAKFFSIQDGIMCQVAWFCRPDADSWWAEEINAAANASTFVEAEHAIRLHVAQYNRGMELSDYNADPELGDNHFKNPEVPYYGVFEEEYKEYIEKKATSKGK